MRPLLLWIWITFLALPAAAVVAPAHENASNLTVVADEMVLPPLAQIARAYAKAGHTPLTIVTKDADSIIDQIEQGLEAHVMITANHTVLQKLTERGLIDVSSRRTVARTGLALVTTNERLATLGVAKRISFASVLRAAGDTPILTSEANSLEGERAFALAATEPFKDSLHHRLSTRSNIDEVFASLRDDQALGLILACQTIGERDIAVISILPESLSPPVNFDVIVLGGELTDEANAFAAFLTSNTAEKIFTRFGYQSGR